MLLAPEFDVAAVSAKVFLIDLLLSGDNAVAIALICRALPRAQMRMAVLFGVVAAILLRIYMTVVVGYLLEIPYLKLAGGLALLLIALKLMGGEENDSQPSALTVRLRERKDLDLWIAVMLVALADAVMSLDNVVALAAVAKGSFLVLLLGLGLSIPLLMYGSMFVAALLNRYPALIAAGGALLGWIGGAIAASDPMIAGWVDQQAPALAAILPPLAAVFVLLEARIVARDRKIAPKPAGSDEKNLVGAMVRLAGRKLPKRLPQPADIPEPPRPAAIRPGAVVLLAEDNPLDQGAARRALESLGCRVETVEDGDKAIRRLEQGGIMLLLTDLSMPALDGFGLAAEIRRRESLQGGENPGRLPIVGLLGYLAGAELAGRCLAAGMDALIEKPLDAARLAGILEKWLPAASGPALGQDAKNGQER